MKKSELDAVSDAVIPDETTALKARVAQLEALVKYYEERLRLSRHKQFGASSEQSGHNSDQLSFFNEAEVLADANVPEPELIEIEKHYRKRTRLTTDKLPEDLPVEVVEHDLPESEKVCPECGGELHVMGRDSRRELVIIPAQVKIREHIRLVYACRDCEKDECGVPIVKSPLAQIEATSRVLGGKQASRDAKGNMRVLIFEGWPYVDAHGRRQLSLRLGDAPAFTQRLGVCVINADAPNKEAAMQYVEWLVGNTNAQFLPMLNAVMTAPEIAKMSVEQNILSYNMSSLIQAGISQEDLAQVEKLKGMLASGDVSKYGPEEAGLARFRQEVAPHMTIMTSPYPVTYDIQEDYLDGKLDADAFIKALQEAAK